MSPLDRLADPRTFREHMERVEVRLAGTGRLDGVTRDQVSLRALLAERDTTARRLASAIADGSYPFRPTKISVLDGPRRREIFAFDAADWLVHGALGAIMADAFEPRLSPAVYSYRPGRSSWEAASSLGGFIREHRRAASSPDERGLYALRADVAAYGDSIPVTAGSPLWPALAAWLEVEPSGPLWRCVTACVRPSVELGRAGESRLACRARGVPVGSPIANPLTNLYLDPVDRLLGERGGFYARFGDDLVFAHGDPGEVIAAAAELEGELKRLGLALNADKRALVHLNAAGRPGPGRLRGTSMITYVGCRIGADGAVGLPAKKIREIIGDLRSRLRRQARLWSPAGDAEPAVAEAVEIDRRGRDACALVSRALDPSNPLAVRHASLLRAAVNDRAQLKQLDHAIAAEVVAAVTGVRGPRGFRRLPYRRLRRELGLPSLVMIRNRS